METSMFKSTFYRFVLYTQEARALKLMYEKAAAFYDVQLIYRCFLALKTHFDVVDIIKMHGESPPFIETRLKSDMSHIGRHLLAPRKRSLNYIIMRYTRKFTSKQKVYAEVSLSFKKFLFLLKNNIDARLRTEQRFEIFAFVTIFEWHYFI